MKRLTATLGVLAILTLSSASLACPLCKEALPNSDAETASSVPAGFNLSIYAMLGGMFAVAGFGGWKLMQVVKQTDRRG